MAVTDGQENYAPPIVFDEGLHATGERKAKPLPMEQLIRLYSLDQLVELHRWLRPKLREVPYHVLHEFIGRKYNKVKERMEMGTTNEDNSAEIVEVPITCAICSGECRRTEERAYYNCGHTYHSKCTLSRTMDNCLVCGQELFLYLFVLEGESVCW